MRGVKGGERSQLLQSGIIIMRGVKGGERGLKECGVRTQLAIANTNNAWG